MMMRMLCILSLASIGCADATFSGPNPALVPTEERETTQVEEPPPDDETPVATNNSTTPVNNSSDEPPPTVEPPTALSPCGNGDCWETFLGGPPCSTDTHDEDYSSGNYNVHAYATLGWDGAPTHIEVEAKSGDWEPVIVLNSADGETLFDGERGAQRDGLTVDAASPTSLTVVSDEPIAIVVFVTSRATLESDFVARIPTDAVYTISVRNDCGTRVTCTVNGNNVRDPACGWLHYVGHRVVPKLPGTRDERLETASIVAWWALKEGVLFLENPIVYSNCNFPDGDARIGPLDSCIDDRAWQVGLSGVQVPWHSDAEVDGFAAEIHPDLTIDEVLRMTAAEAQLDDAQIEAVASSTGTLRRSWLLRNSAIGFAVEAPVVRSECIDRSLRWCYGTGWDTTQLYAPNRTAALGAMEDVKALLDQLAP